MPPLHRLIPLALLLASAPVFAQSSAAEAEHTRLTDDMKRLTARNAWKGVDDAYRRMEALVADQGVVLTYRDHYMGAVAARGGAAAFARVLALAGLRPAVAGHTGRRARHLAR